MEAKGTKFIHGATPSNITPTDDGKYEVTFSNGSSDVFDTIMAATGRTADTAGLNLEAVGVEAVAVEEGAGGGAVARAHAPAQPARAGRTRRAAPPAPKGGAFR